MSLKLCDYISSCFALQWIFHECKRRAQWQWQKCTVSKREMKTRMGMFHREGWMSATTWLGSLLCVRVCLSVWEHPVPVFFGLLDTWGWGPGWLGQSENVLTGGPDTQTLQGHRRVIKKVYQWHQGLNMLLIPVAFIHCITSSMLVQQYFLTISC